MPSAEGTVSPAASTADVLFPAGSSYYRDELAGPNLKVDVLQDLWPFNCRLRTAPFTREGVKRESHNGENVASPKQSFDRHFGQRRILEANPLESQSWRARSGNGGAVIRSC